MCGDNSQRPIDPGAFPILCLKLNTQKVGQHGQLTSYGIVRSSWNGNGTLMCVGSFGTVRRWVKSVWDVTDVYDNREKSLNIPISDMLDWLIFIAMASKNDPFKHSM